MATTPYDGRPPAEVVAAPGTLIRVSWSAIFAGIVLVLAIEILLDVLGAGVGLGLVNPGSGQTPSAGSFGVGAGVWWLVSTIIAFIIGCYAAARLAGVRSRWDGVLHGLVIWGGAVLITVYLLTSAVGGVLGGAFSMFQGTVSAVGSTVGSAVKTALPKVEQSAGITPDAVKQLAEDILQAPTTQDAASMSRAEAAKAIARTLPDLLSGGQKASDAQKRIADIVAAQAHISSQDAEKRVEDAKSRLTDLKNKADQAAESSASAASEASLLAFAALIIGAIAAAVGGSLASPQPRRVVPF